MHRISLLSKGLFAARLDSAVIHVFGRIVVPAAALFALTAAAAAESPSLSVECDLRSTIIKDYIPTGRNAEAIDLLNARIGKGGSDSCSDFDLYSLRSKVFEFEGNLEASLKDLNSAVALQPHDAWILQRRCYVFGQMGRLASARIDCREALSAARKLGEPLIFAGVANTMAGVLAQLGDLDQAFAALQEAVSMVSAAETADPPAQESIFAQAMKQKLLSTRAMIIASFGRSIDAIRALDEAISSASADLAKSDSVLDLRDKRYHIYFDQFWYVEAAVDLRYLIAARPDRPDYLNDLCWTLANIGAVGEAIPNCEAALKIAPDAFATLDSYGFALAKAGRFEDAVVELKKALAIGPTNGWALYHLAQAYKGANDIDAYRTTLAKLKEVAADWPTLTAEIEALSKDE